MARHPSGSALDDLAGKRVLVIGLGLSGRSAAGFCAARGAHVVACDQREDVADPALPPGVEIQRGGPIPDLAQFDLVVPSPGVPRDRYAGATVAWGDIELAYRALPVPVVAVTDTNGKSTTVRLIETMLIADGRRARAAGNVGEAALWLVGKPLDVAILEVSSFQLEAVDAFRPRVGVILGCTPDHLDRHGSLEAYRATKLRLFARQGPLDVAIVNADDAALVRETADLAAERWLVSTRGPVERGAFLDAGTLQLRVGNRPAVLPIEAMGEVRGPLAIDVLAALLAAVAVGAEPAKALGALATFRPLPHRMERVAARNGVTWIDDSKATNPGAAAAALAATGGPIVWIAGGRAKGTGFGELAQAPLDRVRRLLTIGEASAELARALDERVAIEPCGTMDTAVERADALAAPGDTVLLAPACASFDQYPGFEARGGHFRQLVEALR